MSGVPLAAGRATRRAAAVGRAGAQIGELRAAIAHLIVTLGHPLALIARVCGAEEVAASIGRDGMGMKRSAGTSISMKATPRCMRN